MLVPWGCDFMYQNATLVFENTDRLMKEINANAAKYGMTITYATVGEYISAVHKTNTTWPVRKHQDFFPLEYQQGNDWQVRAQSEAGCAVAFEGARLGCEAMAKGSLAVDFFLFLKKIGVHSWPIAKGAP